MNRTIISFAAGATLLAMPAAAADLTLAEAVDYVRVCDAFGSGYWYVPGTDTCLRMSGYVRFDVRGSEAPIKYEDRSRYWDFRTRARLNLQAVSETEYGTLTGYVRMQGDYDPSKKTDGMVYLDRAWLSLGHFLAGYETSAFDYNGGYGVDAGGFRSDQATQQIRLTHKFDNFGLVLSAEDFLYRYQANADTNGLPDLIAALTMSHGAFDARLSGAYVSHVADEAGYAVQFGASMKLDEIAKGDAIRFVAAYASDAGSFTGASKTLGAAKYTGGESWNILGSAVHFWHPNFSTAITGSYVTATNVTTDYAWQAAVSAAWKPVKNLTVGGEVNYTYNTTKSDRDTWVGLLRFTRDFP